jgi:hypothetical protein
MNEQFKDDFNQHNEYARPEELDLSRKNVSVVYYNADDNSMRFILEGIGDNELGAVADSINEGWATDAYLIDHRPGQLEFEFKDGDLILENMDSKILVKLNRSNIDQYIGY